MTVINTNINANIARDAIGRNDRAMATSMERLSTGLRINSAKDDAAGLAIANRMAGQISGLNMAKRNANDAMSMVQTIEGASKEIGSMLVRMRELAVQSASGTYSDTDRAALDLEFDQLRLETTRIQEKTTWNEQALMDGSKSVSIQLGASSGQTMSIDFADWSMENEKVYGTTANTKDINKGSETSVVTFGNLKNGESITVGGLTLTAAADIAAADVAAGFASLAKDVTAGNAVTNGTWSNALTGFSTGTASSGKVTFTSATADSNVDDIQISSTAKPTAVTTQGKSPSADPILAVTTPGAVDAAEVATLTFTRLNTGDTVTVDGFDFTAATDLTAAEAAAAFNTAYTGTNYDATTVDGAVVTLTAQAVGVADPVLGVTGTRGTIANESSVVTFKAMENGDAITVGGLTLTASGSISAADVAAGFASLVEDATAGNDVTNGAWSNALTGFSTGAASTNDVTFTSATADSNVTDIEISSTISATNVPTAVTTDGSAVDVVADTIDVISIHNAEGAAAAIATLDKAITGITSEQAKYGAYLSRLQYASDNLSNLSTNTDQSRSRIQDADYAVETTALARTQIIAQASTAMLAQANQVKQTVLALLQ